MSEILLATETHTYTHTHTHTHRGTVSVIFRKVCKVNDFAAQNYVVQYTILIIITLVCIHTDKITGAFSGNLMLAYVIHLHPLTKINRFGYDSVSREQSDSNCVLCPFI